jgi:hypothetical protein
LGEKPRPALSTNIGALCSQCGLRFSTGMSIGSEARNIVFRGNGTSCPRCGSLQAIPDLAVDENGQIHFIKEAYRILTGPAVSREDIERVAEIARQAQSGALDPASASERVGAVNPAFAKLRKLLVPTDAGAFYQLVGVLLALATLLLTLSTTPTVINQTIINQVIQQGSTPTPAREQTTRTPPRGSPAKVRQRHAPGAPKKSPRRGTVKGWENRRCTCGSGKRSRKCCAAPPTR